MVLCSPILVHSPTGPTMTRKRDVVHRRAAWNVAFADAEILRLTHGVPDRDHVLVYYPSLTTNPYQSLLYSRAIQSGYFPVAAPDLSSLRALVHGKRVILHIHWLSEVFREAKDEHNASLRLEEFQVLIDELLAKGVRILWTVHNILPHDSRFKQHEIKLRQFLVDRVAAIHVMNKQTRLLAEAAYNIPNDKTFHVPHPSYEGWYPNVDNRAVSRLALGVRPTSRVFLCFGSIQPYKGLEYVVRAFKKAFRITDDVVLIIAGFAPDKIFLSKLLQEAAFDGRILIEPARVAEYYVQNYFNAADFAVAANLDLLNSGVIALASTFRVPVIARASSGDGAIPGGLGIGVPEISVDHLQYAFKQACSTHREQYDFSRLGRALKPEKMSKMFFEKLSRLIGG